MNQYFPADNENDPWADTPYTEPGPLPGFVKTVTIIDMVLATLRGIAIPLAIIGLMTIPDDDPLTPTILFEVVGHLGLFTAGLVAGIGILRKSIIGLYAGYANVAITLFTFAIGIWQVTIKADGFVTPPEKMAAILGGGIAILFRFAILVVYIVALMKFKKYLETNNKL